MITVQTLPPRGSSSQSLYLNTSLEAWLRARQQVEHGWETYKYLHPDWEVGCVPLTITLTFLGPEWDNFRGLDRVELAYSLYLPVSYVNARGKTVKLKGLI